MDVRIESIAEVFFENLQLKFYFALKVCNFKIEFIVYESEYSLLLKTKLRP